MSWKHKMLHFCLPPCLPAGSSSRWALGELFPLWKRFHTVLAPKNMELITIPGTAILLAVKSRCQVIAQPLQLWGTPEKTSISFHSVLVPQELIWQLGMFPPEPGTLVQERNISPLLLKKVTKNDTIYTARAKGGLVWGLGVSFCEVFSVWNCHSTGNKGSTPTPAALLQDPKDGWAKWSLLSSSHNAD